MFGYTCNREKLHFNCFQELKGWIEIRTCITDGDVIIPSEASVLQS